MTDTLQDTVNRENAEHGETLKGDAATSTAAATSGQDKREELKARIAAGQQRHDERNFGDQARDAADAAIDFVKEHPVATIVGGLAIGLLIGSMTRSGRRVGRRAGSLATAASEAAVAFGLGLLDDIEDLAKDSRDRAHEAGDRLGYKARELKREADYYTRSLSDQASTKSRLAGRSLSRRLRDVG